MNVIIKPNGECCSLVYHELNQPFDELHSSIVHPEVVVEGDEIWNTIFLHKGTRLFAASDDVGIVNRESFVVDEQEKFFYDFS